MIGGHGLPHHHLTTQWQLKMWLYHFLAGQHSQRGRLFLLLARGAPRGRGLGFLSQSGSLGWALEWVSRSDPGRGRAQNRLVGPRGRAWAGGSQMRLGWEALPRLKLPQLPGGCWGATPSALPGGRSLGHGAG